jgi:hypothetical protein
MEKIGKKKIIKLSGILLAISMLIFAFALKVNGSVPFFIIACFARFL